MNTNNRPCWVGVDHACGQRPALGVDSKDFQLMRTDKNQVTAITIGKASVALEFAYGVTSDCWNAIAHFSLKNIHMAHKVHDKRVGWVLKNIGWGTDLFDLS